MVGLTSLLSSFELLLKAAVAASPAGSGVMLSGYGWPSQEALRTNLQAGNSLLAVYDRKIARDVTRWRSFLVASSTLTPGISISFQGLTATLAGVALAGDSVGLVVNLGAINYGQVVACAAGDTAAVVAAKLATAIGREAYASGNQVIFPAGQVTSLAGGTANVTTNTSEVGRVERGLQIILWSPSEDERERIGEVLEGRLYAMQADFGLTLLDGSAARVRMGASYDMDDEVLSNVARRDFLITVEYGITTTDLAYAVLVPGVNIDQNPALLYRPDTFDGGFDDEIPVMVAG